MDISLHLQGIQTEVDRLQQENASLKERENTMVKEKEKLDSVIKARDKTIHELQRDLAAGEQKATEAEARCQEVELRFRDTCKANKASEGQVADLQKANQGARTTINNLIASNRERGEVQAAQTKEHDERVKQLQSQLQAIREAVDTSKQQKERQTMLIESKLQEKDRLIEELQAELKEAQHPALPSADVKPRMQGLLTSTDTEHKKRRKRRFNETIEMYDREIKTLRDEKSELMTANANLVQERATIEADLGQKRLKVEDENWKLKAELERVKREADILEIEGF
ncbi:hypothetical protein IAT40_007230 [Kwoniella sp. CBS 6097]